MTESRHPARQRYLPLLSILVVLFLALAVLPSALQLPQTNPQTTLEYAPVPPNQNSQGAPGGNLSSLGLGSSGSLATGFDVGLPAGAGGAAGGVGKSPRTKRCVGSPPRQTEDALSPPCAAYFDGNNFGATYKGVTAQEVRVLFYIEGGQTRCVTSRGCETAKTNAYVDLASPEQSDDDFWVRVLRLHQRYFNDRYQTYDRFVHLFAYFDRGSVSRTVEGRRADAADNMARVAPFAVLAYADSGNEQPYLEAIASKGVLNFGSRVGRDASFFRKYPGMIWGYLPSIQIQASLFATYVCRKVVGLPVTFSGNGDAGAPRVLGLLRAENSAYPGIRTFADAVKTQVQDCGGRFSVERTFSSVGHTFSAGDPQAPGVAASNMASFKQAGVTTIIWPQGYETEHSKAAAQIAYYPELVIAGDGTLDGYTPDTYQDQSVWTHAWTVSASVLLPAISATPCYRAMQEADPQNLDGDFACSFFGAYYDDLRQLFTGIQVAGPRLERSTMERGFRAIPAVPSRDPLVPACFYEPGDYTCVKDAIPMWWDSSADNESNYLKGCWRVPQKGFRFVSDTWPREDVAARKSAEDACNAFTGAYSF